MEECVRMMQNSLRSAPTIKKRAKSVYNQRNLGTIKERKKEKQQEKETTNGEMIMKILRMRWASWTDEMRYPEPIFLGLERPSLSLSNSK